MAPDHGLEPRLPGSEPGALPLTPIRYLVRMVRLELIYPFGRQGVNLMRLPFRHTRMVPAKGFEPLIRIGIRA